MDIIQNDKTAGATIMKITGFQGLAFHYSSKVNMVNGSISSQQSVRKSGYSSQTKIKMQKREDKKERLTQLHHNDTPNQGTVLSSNSHAPRETNISVYDFHL